MSVEKDESGRRSIEVSIEVPCTPEEVWEAIATGPGVSAWFMPMPMAEGLGDIVVDMGEGPVKIGEITVWDPPHRFVGEGQNFGPDAPPVATEWTIESRAGGKSVVRVVHSLFASTEDWDDQLENLETGWPRFFRVMRLYLERFRDTETSALISVMRTVDLSVLEAWGGLTEALGVAGKSVGERWSAPGDGTPSMGGAIAEVFESDRPRGLVQLDEPTPGIVSPFAFEMGGQVIVQLNLYLYGDGANAIAARDTADWQAWIDALEPLTNR